MFLFDFVISCGMIFLFMFINCAYHYIKSIGKPEPEPDEYELYLSAKDRGSL